MIDNMPVSAVKFTLKETAAGLEFVKYKAEYQPPPNANCERTWGLTGGVTGTSPSTPTVKLASIVEAALVISLVSIGPI